MANITLIPSEVSIVRNDPDDQHSLPANVVITRGQLVKVDTTTGNWVLANDGNLAWNECDILP